MQSIEFATGDEDEVDQDSRAEELQTPTDLKDMSNGLASSGKGETLEKLLLARNKKLANELTILRVSHQDLQSRLQAAQQELSAGNMDLYEKTRYVSSYHRGAPTSTSSSAFALNGQASSVSLSTPTDRYRSAYEANLSPFAAFRGRETARAIKRMSLPERVVFSITRMVLANRTSRNVFAAYCFALHLLVLGMLYWLGTVDIEKHASNLGEVAAGAAALAGAGPIGAGSGPEAQAHHGDWHQEGFSGAG